MKISKWDDKIMTTAYSYIKERKDICEDILQETYIRIYEVYGGVHPDSLSENTINSFLYPICIEYKKDIRKNIAHAHRATRLAAEMTPDEYLDYRVSHHGRFAKIINRGIDFSHKQKKGKSHSDTPLKDWEYSCIEDLFKNKKYKLIKIKEEVEWALFLEYKRWDGNIRCPKCNCEDYWRTTSRLKIHENYKDFRCSDCQFKFTVTSHTLMHSTKAAFDRWMNCIAYYAIHENNINSTYLSKQLDTKQGIIWKTLYAISKNILVKDDLIFIKDYALPITKNELSIFIGQPNYQRLFVGRYDRVYKY